MNRSRLVATPLPQGLAGTHRPRTDCERVLVRIKAMPWKPLAIIVALLLVAVLAVCAVVTADVTNLGFSLF
jgi:hypothetical protein